MATPKKKPCKTCPGAQRAKRQASKAPVKNVIENPTEIQYMLRLPQPKVVIGITGNRYTVSPDEKTIVVSGNDAHAFNKVIRKSKKVWKVIGPVAPAKAKPKKAKPAPAKVVEAPAVAEVVVEDKAEDGS